MADETSDGIAVLQGEAGRDLRWVVSVDDGRGSLLVMLTQFWGGAPPPGGGVARPTAPRGAGVGRERGPGGRGDAGRRVPVRAAGRA